MLCTLYAILKLINILTVELTLQKTFCDTLSSFSNAKPGRNDSVITNVDFKVEVQPVYGSESSG